jgi:hypothetical protein
MTYWLSEEKVRSMNELSERQNHRCAYCALPLWLPGIDTPPFLPSRGDEEGWRRFALDYGLARIVPRHPSALGALYWPAALKARVATFDHVVARGRGGLGVEANFVIACAADNYAKGAKAALPAFKTARKLVETGTHPHIVYQRTGVWSAQGYSKRPLRSLAGAFISREAQG